MRRFPVFGTVAVTLAVATIVAAASARTAAAGSTDAAAVPTLVLARAVFTVSVHVLMMADATSLRGGAVIPPGGD